MAALELASSWRTTARPAYPPSRLPMDWGQSSVPSLSCRLQTGRRGRSGHRSVNDDRLGSIFYRLGSVFETPGLLVAAAAAAAATTAVSSPAGAAVASAFVAVVAASAAHRRAVAAFF